MGLCLDNEFEVGFSVERPESLATGVALIEQGLCVFVDLCIGGDIPCLDETRLFGMTPDESVACSDEARQASIDRGLVCPGI